MSSPYLIDDVKFRHLMRL